MRLTGAEIVIRLLEQEGIEVISGVPGGANLPLYHALANSSISHILARHEQGAGFIAHGMARSTGKPAVCFATSGPGATNLLTAIADAKLDSVPLVAITGQVSTSLLGTDAFQEVHTYLMTLPISKHNFVVKDANDLLSVIPRAFSIASSGRRGPVVVDIPKDVQQQEIEEDLSGRIVYREATSPLDPSVVDRVSAMINGAKRPIIYAGGGVAASGCHSLLYEIATRNSIPVTLTLMGLGCFPPADPLYLGML